MQIKFKKNNINAVVPVKATGQSAAFELYTSQGVFVKPRERTVIPTGISLEIPVGYCASVRPRSGFSVKGIEGYLVANHVITSEKLRFDADVILGLIDSDYRGDIGIIVKSSDNNQFYIPSGTRLAQLLIEKTEDVEFTLTDSLSDTERGSGGFGSTGTC